MPGPEAKLSFLLPNLNANTSYSAMIRHISTYLHESTDIYTFLHISMHIYTHIHISKHI